MEGAARARLQVRVVVVVYRAELRKLLQPVASADAGRSAVHEAELRHLRIRSLTVLADARAQLNGTAAWHPEVIAEIEAARAMIGHDPA